MAFTLRWFLSLLVLPVQEIPPSLVIALAGSTLFLSTITTSFLVEQGRSQQDSLTAHRFVAEEPLSLQASNR